MKLLYVVLVMVLLFSAKESFALGKIDSSADTPGIACALKAEPKAGSTQISSVSHSADSANETAAK